MNPFHELLQERWNQQRLVCVGLDLDLAKIPSSVLGGKGDRGVQVTYARQIILATRDVACAYKLNTAMFGGDDAPVIIRQIVELVRELAPGVPFILDGKYGDIGNTNDGHVRNIFIYYGVDAVTVNPYLGMEALKPFLDQADRGIIVLVRTSNPGAGELQDLPVGAMGTPFYLRVALNLRNSWNYNHNCSAVAGATSPEELAVIRGIVGPDIPLLIPGIGAQGGEIRPTVKAGVVPGWGMIINNSRGIVFASDGPDWAEAAGAAARSMNDQLLAAVSGMNIFQSVEAQS